MKHLMQHEIETPDANTVESIETLQLRVLKRSLIIDCKFAFTNAEPVIFFCLVL